MARSGKYRSLASIAILRISESELRILHSTISDMSPSSFLELVRDIEDEIDSSIHLSLENFEESSFSRNSDKGLFREIDHIRRKELQITVLKFADLLAMHLKESLSQAGNPVPNFDSRRGLQTWINKNWLCEPWSLFLLIGARSQLGYDLQPGLLTSGPCSRSKQLKHRRKEYRSLII